MIRPLVGLTLVATSIIWAPRTVRAQEVPAAKAPSAAIDAESSLATLQTLRIELAKVRSELGDATRAMDYAVSPERKAELKVAAARLKERETNLLGDIEVVASGLDPRSFATDGVVTFDLMTEMEGLIRPLVEELKEATETPREIERLRGELARLRLRKRRVELALQRLGVLKAKNEVPELEALLDRSLESWTQELRTTATQEAVAEHNLERRVQAQTSFLESTSDVVGSFFSTRGLSMLYALAAFLGTFFALRLFYWVIKLVFLRKREAVRSIAGRLTYVVFNFLTGAIATLAALIALYTTGDWVLLGLALLLLFGVLWAGKNAAVLFLDQIRLLMNLGPVREGESVMYRGVPWLVERLGLFTELVNPRLAGGTLRLAAREVLSLNSRPMASGGESWFPSAEGDWVRLRDGRYGQIASQTPDFVQITRKGGSVVTYETAAFLSESPENLSRGFRIAVTFGVDYAHQSIATTEIPEKMSERLRQVLGAELQDGDIRQIAVELEAAAGSSLDLAALIDLGGRVAGELERLTRMTQRLLVEQCTEQGWNIPFPQLTVHGVAK